MNALPAILAQMGGAAVVAAIVLVVGLIIVAIKCYRKVRQGKAMIRNGQGGTKVSFTGMFVVPIVHQLEKIDISVKRVEISRMAQDGLICEDNMRADIKVAFFVRVNKTKEDVMKVAQCLGCDRASDPQALVEFFDAKFSEALKTVGKQFAFVDLYNSRERFKNEILKTIGTDLNGYVLDDAAIDYLEQTPVEILKADNILDAEGIKKITELTSAQQVLANDIRRTKEKTIVKQDVEAQEAILELNKQLAEAEEKQKREIAEITSREEAAAAIVKEQERLKAEGQRIRTAEELAVAEENKERQVVVAAKNRERTTKVETERVERDRQLEATERYRVVGLADIEKEKAIEAEKRNIQEVIRERVELERSVVEEQEKIKDVEAFKGADREKQVAVTDANREAEAALIKDVQNAEAKRQSAEKDAEKKVIEADAALKASERQAEAKKLLADAGAKEMAVKGMAEVQVMEAEAEALQKHGLAEAKVSEEKFKAEAEGIREKAEAMKLFDGVGKEHEEFKLRLDKQLQVELKQIDVQREIAEQNAKIVAEALKSAKIDIVGGESEFFDKIVGAVTQGKAIDRAVDNSDVLADVRNALLNEEGGLGDRLQQLIGQFGISSSDVANLSVSALIMKLMDETSDRSEQTTLQKLFDMAGSLGLHDKKASDIIDL